MSQIILDDQLAVQKVLAPIQQWTIAQQLRHIRPHEIIKDERVPMLLQALHQPTFVTIDDHFWDRDLCDSKYCLMYFALAPDQQVLIPRL